jgi:MarR family transcriptional regulator, organic hydroperoxide resistance regulator
MNQNSSKKNQDSKAMGIPSEIQHFLCFALYSTSRKMTQLYQRYLEPLGLTYPQLLVLILLKDGQSATVNQLGDTLHLDSGTLTPLLKRMEQKDLILRKRSKEDERSVEISIHKAGVKALENLSDLGIKMLCDLDMTADEVAKLAGRIHKVREQIESRL